MKFYNSRIEAGGTSVYLRILEEFKQYSSLNSGHKKWQSEQVCLPMLEVVNYYFSHEMPQDLSDAKILYSPDLPWAEEHLQERLSGEPLNPPPSHTKWNTSTEKYLSKIDPSKFSHTYPERYNYGKLVKQGARFENGCLDDLIALLEMDPGTRQAYLPIYLPEDIIAGGKGERVPCSLGYHFQEVSGELNVSYIIRSCDVIRHLHNDLFLTWGLTKHIADKLGLALGTFLFICFNLHCFENDEYTLNKRLKDGNARL